MDLLPAVLHLLLEETDIKGCKTLKNVFSGGDALTAATITLFYRKLPHATLYNTYGPTEATVEASVWA